MLTRQKVLQWFVKRVPHPTDTKLMKLLFLTKVESAVDELIPFYDFMPYQYGPFSYILQKDINLSRNGAFYNHEAVAIAAEVTSELLRIYSLYGRQSQDRLMSHVYNAYPYFATRSKVKERYLLSSTSLPRLRPCCGTLNTIHYEERSIDTFLNKLIRHRIDVLVDVRKDPVSMKYGFRRTSLQRYADAHQLSYLHVPELGVDKHQRAELNMQQDYDNLFAEYKLTTLKQETVALKCIEQLLRQKRRIALFCFEKDPNCCHRTCIANILAQRLNMPVCHL
jgi:uncharacterized protein (DUF488 family)